MHKTPPARRFYSIRFKVLLAFIAVVLFILLCYVYFFSRYTYDMAVERYNEQMEPVGSALAGNIDYFITSCVDSVRSIYYNEAAFDLLANRNANFTNSETADSRALFSYMLGVFTASPRAQQIHLYAYDIDRSFLITAEYLQRYMNILSGVTFEDQFPQKRGISSSTSDLSIWVDSSHMMGDYGHFVSQQSRRKQNVFTINIPILRLPRVQHVVALLSVDISTAYIDDNCSINETTDTQVFILDGEDRVVYASEDALTGSPLEQSNSLYGAALMDLSFDGEYATRDGFLIKKWNLDSGYCNWRLYFVCTLDYITRGMVFSQLILVATFLLLVVLMSIVLYAILLRYLHPLSRIAAFIRVNASQGSYNLSSMLTPYIHYRSSNDEISVLIASIDAMLKAINDSLVHQYQLALANEQLELRSFQAQINPHFIYNTLQCIASKSIERGDTDTYSYIAAFGQLLQYAMDFSHSRMTLEQEVQYTHRYVRLQSVRFDRDVRFEAEGDRALFALPVPKMFLQPLAENAILHGRLNERTDGFIRLRAERRSDGVRLVLEDNGQAISREKASELLVKQRETLENYRRLQSIPFSGSDMSDLKSYSEQLLDTAQRGHIGLMNVYMRLLLFYGQESRLLIGPNKYGGTSVELLLPPSALCDAEKCPTVPEGGDAP